MKRRNATRSALFTSIISLLLCVSMLVGTTFAWFTDSVVSGTNVITAGNLDVELYHTNKTVSDEKVTESTALFTDVELWEPGVVAYENFVVANEGNLALKYALSVNFENETVVNGYGLSQALKVAVVEGGFTGGRTDAQALTGLEALESFELSGALEGEEKSQVFGIVIYWEPTDNDNNFNMKNVAKDASGAALEPLTIDLGINLFATQQTYEEDSFGPEYDGGAEWTGNRDYTWYDAAATELYIKTAEQLAAFAALVNGTAVDHEPSVDLFAGKTVYLASNIDLAGRAWTPIGNGETDGFKGTFDGQDFTVSNLKVTSGDWGLGLFGIMAAPAAESVKNLTVNNATVVSGDELAGVVVGYAVGNTTFSNVHVTGNVEVSAVSNAGGIAGYANFANFVDCSVVANEGSSITGTNGGFVGGIVGYHNNGAQVLTNCAVANLTITGKSAVGGIVGSMGAGNKIEKASVENVTLNRTTDGGNPSVGVFSGCWTYSDSAPASIVDSTANDVTLNGIVKDYVARVNAEGQTCVVAHGSEYNGKTSDNVVMDGTTWNNVTDNVAVIDPIDVNALMADGAVINLVPGVYRTTIKVTAANVTINGTEGAVVDCINLNGKEGTTINNVTFNAAGAKFSYDGKGNKQQAANIISGDANKPKKGARNVTIDGCTFTGTFANGGAAIAFTDRNRSSGNAGNITIKNCTFDTENAYYDIYGYYTGNGYFVIEGNTFNSVTSSKTVYLGRYASATPVVVKDNDFATWDSLENAVFLQDHGSYGVSIAAENNTFGG